MKARLGTAVFASLLAFVAGGAAPDAAVPLPAAIAFAKPELDGGGVYVWERTGRVRLFARAAQAPEWSPDGRRLAYLREGELWVADAGGSHRGRVAEGVVSAAWSPDGRFFIAQRADETLAIIRADAARERLLTAGTDPTWSVRNRVAFARGGDLWLIEPNGRGLRRLTMTVAVESDPAWSPNGQLLAYVSTEGSGVDLHVLNVDTGLATRLTTDGFLETSPAWSPDGLTIAFVANRSGVDAPWSVPAAGGSAVSLSGVTRVTHLRWRPAISRELRPDLEQQAPSELSVIESGGRWRLGFRSATDNVGDGPLEIEASRAGRVPTMQTYQRIRLAGGGSRVYRRVGFLRYTYSATHDHWHLMGFQRYELRRADDHALLVRDRKSGFCLTDRWGNAAAGYTGFRRAPVYTDYCARGNTQARAVLQGTSVGYSDVYPAHFHGQNVDVTHVPAGEYVLVHRASPNLLVREARYENNAASIRLRLTWPNGRAKKPRIRVLRHCPASDRCPLDGF